MNNTDDETYDTYIKVLSVSWNTATKISVFEFRHIVNVASKLNITKRNILKVSVMFFEPLGLIICPILLYIAEIIIQKQCNTKMPVGH